MGFGGDVGEGLGEVHGWNYTTGCGVALRHHNSHRSQTLIRDNGRYKKMRLDDALPRRTRRSYLVFRAFSVWR